MHLRFAAVVSLGAALVGCAPTYNVSLKNDTTATLTIDLTKDGPPYEDNWASPEDIATRAKLTENFASVYPGLSATVIGMQGSFPAGVHPVVRIYRGDLIIADMLNTKPGPNRVDVILKPGDNRLLVHDRDGTLRVQTVP